MFKKLATGNNGKLRLVVQNDGHLLRPVLHVYEQKDQDRLLEWLSTRFQIPCNVRHKKKGRSKAYVRRKPPVLIISDTSPLGKLYICFHEFAHLLSERNHPGHGHKHGRYFREALCSILKTAKVSEEVYPWKSEYKLIYQWAQRTHRSRDVSQDSQNPSVNGNNDGLMSFRELLRIVPKPRKKPRKDQ